MPPLGGDPPLVGNDVVDLNEPATRGKAGQARFLQRVCVARERRFVQVAAQPEVALWLLWSAKETAYKIAKRRQSDILFVKKKFVVEASGLAFEMGRLQGHVVYENTAIPVRWQCEETFVHCTGYWPGGVTGFSAVDTAVARVDDLTLEDISLDEPELQSVRSLPSRRVRQLAKRLLSKRGLNDVQVVRERIDGQWKAPRIWREGLLLDRSALSLSHHGRYVAVVLWLAP